MMTTRRVGGLWFAARMSVRQKSPRLVALVAVAAAMFSAAPAAESGQRQSADLLAGSPRIGTVRALVPKQGRYAGRLIVWVRVDHARGTRRALGGERPESVHTARVVARVGKASRFATERLELDRRRLAHGYFLRFSKRAARAVAAGVARVPVAIRVVQTVDLDSDGDNEDRALATASRSVPLARPATTIEPTEGSYVSLVNDTDDVDVANGAVTGYSLLSGMSVGCYIGPANEANEIKAPVDPQTGQFSFTDVSGPYVSPTVTVTVQGTFTSSTEATFNTATIQWGGCTYTYPQPQGFVWRFS